jgi:hypothetical protein
VWTDGQVAPPVGEPPTEFAIPVTARHTKKPPSASNPTRTITTIATILPAELFRGGGGPGGGP